MQFSPVTDNFSKLLGLSVSTYCSNMPVFPAQTTVIPAILAHYWNGQNTTANKTNILIFLMFVIWFTPTSKPPINFFLKKKGKSGTYIYIAV